MSSYFYSNYDPNKRETFRFLGLNRQRYTFNGEFEDMRNMSSNEYPSAAPAGAKAALFTFPNPDVDGKAYEDDLFDDTIEKPIFIAPDRTNTPNLERFTGIYKNAFYYNGVIKSNKYHLPYGLEWTVIRKGKLYILSGFSSKGNVYRLFTYNIVLDEFRDADATMDDMICKCYTSNNKNYISALPVFYNSMTNVSVTDEHGYSHPLNNYSKKYLNGGSFLSSTNIFENYFAVGDLIMIENFPEHDGKYNFFSLDTEHDSITIESNAVPYINTFDVDSIGLDSAKEHDIIFVKVLGFSTAGSTVGGSSFTNLMQVELLNKDNSKLTFGDFMSGHKYAAGVRISKLTHKFDNAIIFNNSLFGTTPNGDYLLGSFSGNIADFYSTGVNSEPLYTRLSVDNYGSFTGLAIHNGKLIAFKEDSIHIMHGDNFENYTTTSISGYGCIDRNSIQSTPFGLVFLSDNGFYLYNGSATPVLLSQCFYHSRYDKVISGFDGNRYYAYARRSDVSKYELLVYDFRYKLWHIDDTKHAYSGFFKFAGQFYGSCDNTLYQFTDTADVKDSWSFTSVSTHNDKLDLKSITEIWIRATIPEGCKFSVFTSVDGDPFKYHGQFGHDGIAVFRIPVKIDFGNTFRYKIEGCGNIIIHHIEILTQQSGRTFKNEVPSQNFKRDEMKELDFRLMR